MKLLLQWNLFRYHNFSHLILVLYSSPPEIKEIKLLINCVELNVQHTYNGIWRNSAFSMLLLYNTRDPFANLQVFKHSSLVRCFREGVQTSTLTLTDRNCCRLIWRCYYFLSTTLEQQGIGHHISSHHQRTGLPLTKSKSGPTLTITPRTMGAVPRRGRLKAKQVEVMKVTDLISI